MAGEAWLAWRPALGGPGPQRPLYSPPSPSSTPQDVAFHCTRRCLTLHKALSFFAFHSTRHCLSLTPQGDPMDTEESARERETALTMEDELQAGRERSHGHRRERECLNDDDEEQGAEGCTHGVSQKCGKPRRGLSEFSRSSLSILSSLALACAFVLLRDSSLRWHSAVSRLDHVQRSTTPWPVGDRRLLQQTLGLAVEKEAATAIDEAAGAGAATGVPNQAADPTPRSGTEDRQVTLALLLQIGLPVLRNLANGTLKSSLPTFNPSRHNAAPLEAFGRLLAGMAPWLELGPDATPEGVLRQEWIQLARKAIGRAVDPSSPDYMLANPSSQTVVDTAYLSLGLLRAPKQLWGGLPAADQERLVSYLETVRGPGVPDYGGNWALFPAVTEAALRKFKGNRSMAAIERAVALHDQWYLGDGMYGDGSNFHWDYYNSYVIQPSLLAVLSVCREVGHPLGDASWPRILARAQRHAVELERLISPEGTFPVMGRTSSCRVGAFQHLSLIALLHELPTQLKPGGVRAALTAVITRVLSQPNTFDAQGWLQVGVVGHQPSIAESYISTGSGYHTATGFLHLGLPPEDPLWTDAAASWTQKRMWSGADEPADHYA